VRTLLQEAVPAAMEAALTDLKVRRYNISGKEPKPTRRMLVTPAWVRRIIEISIGFFRCSCGLVFTN